MPIYEYNGKRYNIPEAKAQELTARMPGAKLINEAPYYLADNPSPQPPSRAQINVDVPEVNQTTFDGEIARQTAGKQLGGGVSVGQKQNIADIAGDMYGNRELTLPDHKNAAQEQEGFWATGLGDALEKLGAGAVRTIAGFGQVGKQSESTMVPGEKIEGDKNKRSEALQGWFGAANTLSERGDRFGVISDPETGETRKKTYADLWKEGKPLAAAGEALLTATESAPTSIMAMLPVGLPLIAVTSAGQKYNEIDNNPDTKDLPEWKKILNASASGAIEGLTERLGAKVDMKVFEPVLKKMGEQTVKGILKKGGIGALIQTITEGGEEVISQLGGNVVDYATGVSDEYKPFEGVQDSFVYGAAGGAQFGGVTGAGTIYRAVEQHKANVENAKVQNTIRLWESINKKQSQALPALNNEKQQLEAELGDLTTLSYEEVLNSPESTPELIQARERYDIVNAEYEGVMENLKREVDDFIAPQVKAIQDVATADGMITELNVGTEEAPDIVYLAGGNIAINEDGTIDPAGTAPLLTVKNSEGKKRLISRKRIVTAQQDDLDTTIEGIKQRAYEKFVRPLADKLEGKTHFQNGEQVEYVNAKGETVAGTVTAKQNNTVTVVGIDGKKTETFTEDELAQRLIGETIDDIRTRDVIQVELNGQVYDADVTNIQDGIAELHIPSFPEADGRFQDVTAAELRRMRVMPQVEGQEQVQEGIKKTDETPENEGSATGRTVQSVSETGEPQAESHITPEQQQEQFIASLPKTKEGDVDYTQIEDDDTFITALKSEFPEDAAEIVEEYRKQAQKRLSDADRVQDPVKKKRAQRAAQAQVDRFSNMYERLNPKAQYQARVAGLEEGTIREREAKMGEYLSLRDYLLRNIATGKYKFRWNKNDTDKGLGGELFATKNQETERKKRISFLNNNGYSPESLAEYIVENAGEGSEINPGWFTDESEVRSEIIDILLRHDTPTSMIDAATELRKQPETYEEYMENFVDPAVIFEYEANEASQDAMLNSLATPVLHSEISDEEVELYFSQQISEEEYNNFIYDINNYLNNINFEQNRTQDGIHRNERTGTGSDRTDASQVTGTEAAANEPGRDRGIDGSNQDEELGGLPTTGEAEITGKRSSQDSIEQPTAEGAKQEPGRPAEGPSEWVDEQIEPEGAKADVNPTEAQKLQQFDIIQASNPMLDDVHTGIRSADEILTAEEAFSYNISNVEDATPDFTSADMAEALRTGKVTVYSSYPIENGVFVTPSKMEAQNYAGEGKVYSKNVPVTNVAWIDQTQGQYADVTEQKQEPGRLAKGSTEGVKQITPSENVAQNENINNFVTNDQQDEKPGETRLDNRPAVEGGTIGRVVGGQPQTVGINRTIQASNSAGSVRADYTAEELEELESRGLNPYWDKPTFHRILKAEAQKNGVWLDKSYLSGKTLLHDQKTSGTSENDMYLNPDGKAVTKLNNLSYVKGSDHHNNLNSFIDRINAHNALFPELAYTIIGFMENKNGFPAMVLEQPFISDVEGNATQEEINDYLTSRGFKLDGTRRWSNEHQVWTNGVHELFDARPANVLKGNDGEFYFIDTFPHSVEYMTQPGVDGSTSTNPPRNSPNQTTSVENNHEELSSTNNEQPVYQQQVELKESEVSDQKENAEQQQVDKNENQPEYGANNKIITTDRYNELREQMRKKLNNLNVGFDPEVFSIGAQMAMYHIESGAHKFADFAKRMVADLGDAIRPYLKASYEGARAMPGMEDLSKTMDSYNDVLAFDVNQRFEEAEVTKEPWQMTSEEWFNYKFNKISKKDQEAIKNNVPGFAPLSEIRKQTDSEHYGNIKQAISEGKNVPEEVLADYPELGKGPEAVKNKKINRNNSPKVPKSQNNMLSLFGEEDDVSPINTNQDERVLQGNSQRLHQGSRAGSGSRLHTGGTRRNSGIQSNEIPQPDGTQQRSTEREGGLLPGDADVLNTEQEKSLEDSPALVPFEADRNDVEAFNKSKKYADNIEAIRTVLTLITENRKATPDEKKILSRYVGFGGLKEVLLDPDSGNWNKSDNQYKDQVREVIELANRFDAATGSKDTFNKIRGSILNAHYTSATVIEGIYNGLKKIGFKKGNILEPSAGIGNFITYMPESIKGKSNISAVELDNLTGNILKYLHDNVAVQISGIENAVIPNNSQDLVISNVPFGNYKVYDKTFKGEKEQFLNRIHNYFFAKAIDQAREGGLIVFVTSKGVLDAPGNEAIRRYLNQNAEFLGAVRLPSNTFQKTANTQVTTDVIFLQKSKSGNSRERFIGVKEVDAIHKDGGTEKVSVNEYFINHPENMLGTIEAGGLYRRNDYSLIDNGTSKDLSKVIRSMLPENVFTPVKSAMGLQANDIKQSIEDVKEGNIVISNGSLFKKEEGVAVEIKINEPAAKIEKYIDLRNKLMGLIYSEYINIDSKELDNLRSQLNKSYDEFVKKYGKLEKSIKKIVKEDADGYNVQSLEIDGRKADIFTKRTISPISQKTHVESIDEAIIASLSETAGIDMERISQLTGKSMAEVVQESKGKLFEEPGGGFVTRDEYLSGNVKKKLREAKKAVEEGFTEFQYNIDELESVIPADIPAIQIEARAGSRWIPASVYTEFAQHILKSNGIVITYSKAADQYSHNGRVGTVDATTKYGTSRVNGADVLVHALHINPPKVFDYVGTGSDRVAVLNQEETDKAMQKYRLIRDTFEDWVYKSQDRRTLLGGIYNERFNTNVKRRYDGSHLNIPGINGVVLRDHQKDAIWMLLQNGGGVIDHLVGAGKTFVMVAGTMEMKRTGVVKKPMIIALKSTIPQIVESYRSAYPMAKVLAPMEKDFEKKNRMRLFSKIANNEWDCIIMSHENYGKIPHEKAIQEELINDELEQLREEEAEYKAENNRSALKGVLIRIKNLEARLDKLADISKDNSLTFEQMGIDHIMVDESQQFKNLSYLTKQRGIAGLGKAEGSKRSFNLLVGLRYLQRKNKADKGATFLSGTPITNSIVEMYSLLNYLRPNKMAELGFTSFDSWATTFANPTMDIEFTVTNNIKQKTRFREFMNVPELSMLYTEIADIRTDENLKLDKPKMKGNGYTVEEIKMNEDQIEFGKRLTKFAETKDGELIGRPPLSEKEMSAAMLLATNLSSKMAIDMRLISNEYQYNPEGKIAKLVNNVARIFNETSEYKGTQLIFSDLGTPKSKTNKTALLKDYLEDEVGLNQDSLIELFGDYNAQGHRYPALSTVKKRMIDNLEMSEEEVEQIVLDSENSIGSFDVYNEVKFRLIEQGIPEEQIVFIHDYNTNKRKEDLFKKVNEGEIRIVLGSTQKLGTGVNVQERVSAVHHVDVPWTPASMEQRNGRAIRQGNWVAKKYLNNELPVYAYATERTLDAYKYQLLHTKQRFLNQVKSGDIEDRVLKEGDGDAESGVNYAELVAMLSGNKDILLKARLEEKVAQLKRQKRNFEGELYESIEKKKEKEDLIPIIEKNISESKENVKEITDKAVFDEYGKLVITSFNVKEYKDDVKGEKGDKDKKIETARIKVAKAAIEYAEKWLKKAKYGDKTTINIGGYDILMQADRYRTGNNRNLFNTDLSLQLSLQTPNGSQYEFNLSEIPGVLLNNIQKIITDRIPDVLSRQQAVLEKTKGDIKAYDEIIKVGDKWSKQEEYDNALKELKEVNDRLDADIKKNESGTPQEESEGEENDNEDVRFRSMDESGFYSTVEDALRELAPNGMPLFRKKDTEAREAYAMREWNRAKNAINKLSEKMGLDVEIMETTEGLPKGKAESKGWYEVNSKKITIVMPNHTSSWDAQATLLHEAVGHHGLRELFGEHFDTFLDNVYNNAEEGIKDQIDGIGGDTRRATDEYLSRLAEDQEILQTDRLRGFFNEVRKFFFEMLAKLGFNPGFKLSENELKYILWRSYNNLAEPGRYRSIVGHAKDVAMQHSLKVGNYAEKEVSANVAEEPIEGLPKTIIVDGIDRITTNSDGKTIASTEEGVRNFWRWFGGKPDSDYLATNPNQIKSATGNIGTFDPDNDDIRFRSYKDEVSERQYQKAEELLSALEKEGFNDFHISRSITDFGVSTYIHGAYNIKFRISDHSVTNPARILSEIHYSENTPVDVLVSEASSIRDEAEKRAKERMQQFDAETERKKIADEKWERIKSHFKGKVFKRNDRTYQSYEEFSKKGDYKRSDILQTVIGEKDGKKAFSYEWAEPTSYDKWGNPTNSTGLNKPSTSYIEAYNEESFIIETHRLSSGEKMSEFDERLKSATREGVKTETVRQIIDEIESVHASEIEATVVNNKQELIDLLRMMNANEEMVAEAEDPDVPIKGVYFRGMIFINAGEMNSVDDVLKVWVHENFHAWMKKDPSKIVPLMGVFSEETLNNNLYKGYHKQSEAVKIEEILAFAVEKVYVGGPLTSKREIRDHLDPIIKQYLDYATEGEFSKRNPDFGRGRGRNAYALLGNEGSGREGVAAARKGGSPYQQRQANEAILPGDERVPGEEVKRADDLFDNIDNLKSVVKDYGGFLGKVFEGAPNRGDMLAYARENGFDKLGEGIEQYLADVEDPAELSRIKELLDVDMPDNALRYMLWRNANPNENTVVWKAKDAVKTRELDENILFRKGEVPSSIKNDKYEKRIRSRHNRGFRSLMYGIEEGWLDRMASLRILQNAITGGKAVSDKANAYMLENQLTSRNTADIRYYTKNLVDPFVKQIHDIFGRNMNAADEYMNAKHGLERNDLMAEEEAKRKYAKNIASLNKEYADEKIDEDTYNEKMEAINGKIEAYAEKLKEEKDYSGLTAIAAERGREDFKAVAQEIVAEIEGGVPKEDIDALWSHVNKATKWILDKQYNAGIMTKETYEKIRNMYKYYVPLRGFEEVTATDLYEYIDNSPSNFEGTVKKAYGRTSKSESPTATIMSMGESGIMQANRNRMKQAFYRLVATNPSNYASIEDVWFVETADGFEERFPKISPTASAEEVLEAIADFNNEMADLAAEGRAFQGKNKLDVGVKIMKAQASEHVIRVWIAGEEKVIFINGNPRAAQAINGLLQKKPAEEKSMRHGVEYWSRQMSANFTSRNPAFMVTNLMRDVQFAVVSAAVKEGMPYSSRLAKNVFLVGKTISANVFKDGNKDNAEFQKYWEEFEANGGETGYANLHSIDYNKKYVKKKLREFSDQRDFLKPFRSWVRFMENGNRTIEDMSRFATYVTSRQIGRSIERSVSDAKEITINFNRKGSGGFGANLIHSFYLFSNPALQSMRLMGMLAKNHPVRFTAMLSTAMGAGFMVPMINELLLELFGDDDDKEKYRNITPWVRRNNLVLYVPGTKDKFVTLMLPHELRAFYGIGEMAYEKANGGLRRENMAVETAKQMTAMLPIDPMGGPDWWVPDALKPPYQAYVTNRNFMGSPIYRDTPWNKLDPEWTKAYKGTPELLVEAAKGASDITGGDDVVPGWANANPARVYHLFSGYLGGFMTTYTDMSMIAFNLLTGRDVRANDVPVVNKLIRTSDEKTEELRINSEYFYYIDWIREYEHRTKGYEKRVQDPEYRDKYMDVMRDKEQRMYNFAKGQIAVIDQLKDYDEEKANEMKEQFVRKMWEYEDQD